MAMESMSIAQAVEALAVRAYEASWQSIAISYRVWHTVRARGFRCAGCGTDQGVLEECDGNDWPQVAVVKCQKCDQVLWALWREMVGHGG